MNGLTADDVEETWNATTFPDGERFYDYKHTETEAPVLKAQHPEIELWSPGVHAKAAGATPEQLAPALELQRQAQWRLDFIAAENSMGFHAPQEAARVLGEAADLARQGRIEAMNATPVAAASAAPPTP